MSNPVYESSVYSQSVTYKNFQGVEKTQVLYFALDPLKLMELVSGLKTKTPKKSGNPALKNKPVEITNEEQLRFLRELAVKSAGVPSEDGEEWYTFDGFENSIVGKAFLAKLTASDSDRREFSEKVVLDPFRSFVAFAVADPSNSQEDIKTFRQLLAEAEKTFTVPTERNESIEERRSRLAAEMAALEADNG